MDDRHGFGAGGVQAEVLAHGAELCSLRDASGRQVMWDGGPAWPRHAPVLFPIVGELRDGAMRVDGRTYRMGRHGFARTSPFAWARREADGCTLVLTDDAATRAQYPYAFRLELDYRATGAGLRVELAVTNTGAGVLPCSAGFHPAFRWPLEGGAKEEYRIALSDVEGPEVAQLDGAGLVARLVPNPLQGGRVLALSDAAFARDALVLDPVRSHSAQYGRPGAAGLSVAWEGASSLGLWSKPADFVCIEPWHGTADPAGFDGAFPDKPGLWLVPPGERRVLAMTITLGT